MGGERGSGSSIAFGCAALLAVVIGATRVAGVDTPSVAPEYLQRTMRPQWRFVAISTVLQEISEVIEKPVNVSGAIRAASETEIVLIDDNKPSVRSVLELLERTQHLHFVAEPLRLLAQSESEHLRSLRRLVNLDLRDYGLFFRPQSAIGAHLGFSSPYRESGRGSPFGFGESEATGEESVLNEIQNLFQERGSASREDGVEMRGSANVMVLATPDEEARLRRDLDDLYTAVTRRSSWRVHFGVAPAASASQGGLLPAAQVRELVSQLESSTTLTPCALDGQFVTASARDKTGRVGDVEINQTGVFPVVNPIVGIDVVGKSVTLRPSVGRRYTLLGFDAQWVEAVGTPSKNELVAPALSTQNVISGSLSENKGQASSAILRESGEVFEIGRKLTLEQATLWSWSPQGEVFLPKGFGLVLLGRRGERTIVIAVEEVGP